MIESSKFTLWHRMLPWGHVCPECLFLSILHVLAIVSTPAKSSFSSHETLIFYFLNFVLFLWLGNQLQSLLMDVKRKAWSQGSVIRRKDWCVTTFSRTTIYCIVLKWCPRKRHFTARTWCEQDTTVAWRDSVTNNWQRWSNCNLYFNKTSSNILCQENWSGVHE